ncbi:MAG TPA: YihY/virulence factor BrkB family protein [Bryobacteraceae bacterium]|nr:YihY/virulence factor BrkB family protein [Bryobacteraceae bacterium]
MRPTWRALPYVLQRTVVASIDDGCFTIAKGAAYSALLSFFPVLTSVATVLVMTRAGFVSKTITDVLQKVLPPGSEGLVLAQFRARGQKSISLLIVALLLSLWAASSVIKSLMQGFHAAYRIPRSRSFFRETGVAIGLVFLSAIPLIGASALVLFGEQAERAVVGISRLDPVLNPLAHVYQLVSLAGRYLLALGATVALTCILYYYGPYRRQRWSAVWRGAVLATILWFLATKGFATYVRHIGRYNVLYGSVGASIALLIWMYLISAIAILGCEFNAEFERLSGIEERAG